MPDTVFVITLQDVVGVILLALGAIGMIGLVVADKIARRKNRRNKNG